jgi:hypothetical protein
MERTAVERSEGQVAKAIEEQDGETAARRHVPIATVASATFKMAGIARGPSSEWAPTFLILLDNTVVTTPLGQDSRTQIEDGKTERKTGRSPSHRSRSIEG